MCHVLDTYFGHVTLVHAAINSNTYAVYGRAQEKELTELGMFISWFANSSCLGLALTYDLLVPGILSQLGPDSLASLRKLAEAYQAAQGNAGGDDDDEIPELVENFDKAEVSETAEEKAE